MGKSHSKHPEEENEARTDLERALVAVEPPRGVSIWDVGHVRGLVQRAVLEASGPFAAWFNGLFWRRAGLFDRVGNSDQKISEKEDFLEDFLEVVRLVPW